MKILGIDTSGKSCSVALAEGFTLLGETKIVRQNAHSESLLVLIENLLKTTKTKLDELQGIALAIGPGSFTGLRIGLSVAKGLAFSKNLKIIGVKTDLALAFRTPQEKKTAVLLDAFSGQFYFSIFGKTDEALPTETQQIQIVTELSEPNEQMFLAGEGLQKLAKVPENFLLLPEEFSFVSAFSVAKIGYLKALKNEFDDLETLSPFYVKGFAGIN
ncbi:tRNA (adenosine(37)-N6)-threonylcarbamoyltransferase complex dimerization subunit type 1 TsaB [bacterium]|nr:tRNA (adenosine(37)-N6)-threonylcarbamoyltransferase complex dimerization subunit type 1 TsaB [bacterium]